MCGQYPFSEYQSPGSAVPGPVSYTHLAPADKPGTVTYSSIDNTTTGDNDKTKIVKLAEMPAKGKIDELKIENYKVTSIKYSNGGKVATYTSAGWTVQ